MSLSKSSLNDSFKKSSQSSLVKSKTTTASKTSSRPIKTTSSNSSLKAQKPTIKLNDSNGASSPLKASLNKSPASHKAGLQVKTSVKDPINASPDKIDKHKLINTDSSTSHSSKLQHQANSPLLQLNHASPASSVPTLTSAKLASLNSPLSASKGFFVGVASTASAPTKPPAASAERADNKDKLKKILRSDIVDEICSNGETPSKTSDRIADIGDSPNSAPLNSVTFSMSSLSIDQTGKMLLKSILKRRHLPVDIQGASSIDGSLQEVTAKPYNLTRSISCNTGIDQRSALKPSIAPEWGSGLKKSRSFHSGDNSEAASNSSLTDDNDDGASESENSTDNFPKTLRLLKPKGDSDFEDEEEEIVGKDMVRRKVVRSLGSLSKINFSSTVEVLPTFKKTEYNRRPDANVTFRQLTPQLKVQIREELNTFKKGEMQVHEHSSQNTCFH